MMIMVILSVMMIVMVMVMVMIMVKMMAMTVDVSYPDDYDDDGCDDDDYHKTIIAFNRLEVNPDRQTLKSHIPITMMIMMK